MPSPRPRLLARIGFSLDQLKYNYPEETIGNGETAQQTLERLTWEGAQQALSRRHSRQGQARRSGRELSLIAYKGYAAYFLTVHDIVRYARDERKILCQGRGSAANSAVCFCLGITEVDPINRQSGVRPLHLHRAGRAARYRCRFRARAARGGDAVCLQEIWRQAHRADRHCHLLSLQERRARNRQGVRAFRRHHRRAQPAALGLGHQCSISSDVSKIGLRSRTIRCWPRCSKSSRSCAAFRAISASMSAASSSPATRSKASCRSPRPAMESRTIIEWNKDDIDALGILKVDVLALGMLSCLRRAFELMHVHYGQDITLVDLLAEEDDEDQSKEARVYAMTHRADTHRRVPDRKPGADVDAAAAEARKILRSGHRGRHRPPGPDPGRHGASLSEAPAAASEPGQLSHRRTEGRAGTHPWHSAVPGTGDADRHGRRRLLRRARPISCGAPWRP